MGVIRRSLALALLTAVALAAPAAARPHKVAYLDASGYPVAVQVAVAQWNRVQTGIKLVPTTDEKKAVIPIKPVPSGSHYAAGGLLGVLVNQEAFDTFSLPQQATLISHEIGHALRLDDRKKTACSVMSAIVHDAVLNPDCRPTQAPGSRLWRCGANTSDARKLVALYGGKVRPSNGFCTLPEGALNIAATGSHGDISTGTIRNVVEIRSAATINVQPTDVGLLIGPGFYPLDGGLAAGSSGTITYAACLLSTTAQLYSPTFDTFLGAAVQVASPSC
jgi:hypothetical protein